MTDKGRRALAEAIKDRRNELGLGQGDLASAGGPSIVTVGQLERCQIEQPQPATLQRLDTALAWEQGTAASILHSKPRPKPQADPDALDVMEAIRRDKSLLPEAREHLLNQYQLLLRVAAADTRPVRSLSPVKRPTPVAPQERDELDLPAVARKRPAPRKRRT